MYHLDIIKLLVEYGADPFGNENALLIRACTKFQVDVVEYLISIGVDITKPNNEAIWNSIFHNIKLMKLLLDNGANPNGIYKYGDEYTSLLECCIINNRFDQCELLFSYGADINSCRNIIDEKWKHKYIFGVDVQKFADLFLEHGLDISKALLLIK